MARSGFTFIELLIVIVIIGIISGTTVITFDSARARVLFQNEAAKIQDLLSLARNSAKSEKAFGKLESEEVENSTDLEKGIVVEISFSDFVANKIRIYSTNDLNFYTYDNDKHQVLEDYNLDSENNFLLIDQLNALDFDEEILNFEELEKVYITFSAKQECNFIIQDNEVTNNGFQLIQFPLQINENPPRQIRYLYLHSVACSPEILIDNLLETDEE